MEATGVEEDIKEKGREVPGPGWGLKGVRLLFTWPSQNMASMKDTGNKQNEL